MPCNLVEGSLAHRVYKHDVVLERHRHRYELNREFFGTFSQNGMLLSGFYEKKNLVEIVELPDHPWFLAAQFHPEWRSKPDKPHPLFASFVKAMVRRRQGS